MGKATTQTHPMATHSHPQAPPWEESTAGTSPVTARPGVHMVLTERGIRLIRTADDR